ncbi:hypothetical protein [Sporosarcina highlanderae]|uniref:Uncharacterized protein n=1 Tax=Sporosarcina highlanderae TaxID=3035916 RepID=A0ABT8JL88_9BACL|nr:hypothetical protein [Sporosarcina highlanderae]MDN4605913.1 hypothetical protein [Sporosarcina highlanderae]
MKQELLSKTLESGAVAVVLLIEFGIALDSGTCHITNFFFELWYDGYE